MVTVAIFCPETDFSVDPDEDCGLLDQIKLPESSFKRAQSACKEFGISLADFFLQAINEKIARDIDAASTNAINAAMGFGGAL